MSEADCIMRVLSPADPGRLPRALPGVLLPLASPLPGAEGGAHCVVLLMWSMYSRRPSCCRTSQPCGSKGHFWSARH